MGFCAHVVQTNYYFEIGGRLSRVDFAQKDEKEQLLKLETSAPHSPNRCPRSGNSAVLNLLKAQAPFRTA
jgi:hypothetical protein